MSTNGLKMILKTVLISCMALLFSWSPVSAELSDTISESSSSTVTEETTITTDIAVGVSQTAEVGHSAASSGTATGTSNNNQITESKGTKKSADIWADSLSGSSGIISINQAPGTLNNQGSAVNVTYATEATDTLLQATTALQNQSSGNEVSADTSKITNEIHGNAFYGVTGIITVNQSAGSLNTQTTLVNLTIGASSAVSLSDADLGMLNANNTITDIGVSRTDSLSTFALQGAKGIISINQSSGCLNHQVNAISVSVREFTLY